MPSPDKYAASGVDLNLAGKLKDRIKALAQATFRPGVVGDVGLFSGLFQVKGFQNPVLAATVDGVGTKLKIAAAMGKHDTVGLDIVHHCANDLLPCGATPLFFLDYIAMGKLEPAVVEAVAKGLSQACQGIGCVLLGGETAEMPGVYPLGEYDLVGFMLGAVEKEAVIDGSRIKPGDLVFGLPSSGLHTNGYSLVRKIFHTDTHPHELREFYPDLGRTLGEELLEPHRCYYPLVKPALPLLKGLAHITGGGLLENPPRILPEGVALELKRGSWPIPPIFSLIQKRGEVTEGEMCRVFNMGLGLLVVAGPEDRAELTRLLPEALLVGRITAGKGEPRVVLV